MQTSVQKTPPRTPPLRAVTVLSALLGVAGLCAVVFAGWVPFSAYKAVADALARDGVMEQFTPAVMGRTVLCVRLAGAVLLLIGVVGLYLRRTLAEYSVAALQAPVFRLEAWRAAGRRAQELVESPIVPTALITFACFWAFYSYWGIELNKTRILDHYDALFQSDPPRVIVDIAHREPNGYRTTVHPIYVLLLNPTGLFLSRFTPDRATAAVLVNAFGGALAVVLAQIFFFSIGMPRRGAVLWSWLVGVSAAHMVFASTPETHIFAACALALALLAWVTRGDRLVHAVPPGILAFGFTLTNIIPATILYVFSIPGKWGWRTLRRAALYGVLVVGCTSFLSVAQYYFYEETKIWFLPQSYATGGVFNYFASFRSAKGFSVRAAQLAGHLAVYDMVAPEAYFPDSRTWASSYGGTIARVPCPAVCRDLRIADHRKRGPVSHPPSLTFQSGAIASFNATGVITALLWLGILGAGIYELCTRPQPRRTLLVAIALCLAYFFSFHLIYGDDLFLYTPHWTFLLVAAVALALERHWESRWLESGVALLVAAAAIHNAAFMKTVVSVFGTLQ